MNSYETITGFSEISFWLADCGINADNSFLVFPSKVNESAIDANFFSMLLSVSAAISCFEVKSEIAYLNYWLRALEGSLFHLLGYYYLS